jgi:hypothetical protein
MFYIFVQCAMCFFIYLRFSIELSIIVFYFISLKTVNKNSILTNLNNNKYNIKFSLSLDYQLITHEITASIKKIGIHIRYS